jgi:hypothetical protein
MCAADGSGSREDWRFTLRRGGYSLDELKLTLLEQQLYA